jgi:MFS family permease
MLSTLAPLRSRNFALVWSSALISNIGSWMQTVAVGLLITTSTGRAGWTGLVAAASFLPIGLLSPLGGVMADRVDRRRWLLVTTAGEAALATALAIVAGSGLPSPVVVTLLVLGGGAMAAVGLPAYQAMLPELVAPDELLAAVSLSSAQFNLGRVVGPVLAGVVIVTGGYGWAFAINAASFFAVIAALLVVRLPPMAHPLSVESVRHRLVAGARAAVGSPSCRFAIAMITVVALTASPFIALVPAMAVKVWGSRAGGTSLLVTCQGIGAVAGALAMAPLARRFGRARMLTVDLLAVAACLGWYALSPNIVVAAVAIVGLGAAYIGVLSGLNTTIQLQAPDGYRARILGLYMMALGIGYPIGALVQGALGDALGLRGVTLGGAAILAAVVVAVGARDRSATRRSGVRWGSLDSTAVT